jgi:putative glutamine amidotransferase
MRKPVIGLTAYRTDSGRGYGYISVTEAYSTSILEAGAIPILIPLGLSRADLSYLRGSLDGILFTGGGDIDLELYGGMPHPSLRGVDTERDIQEIALVKEAIEERQPFLGICRGLQVINVARGGTLYSDLKAQLPDALDHDFTGSYPRDRITHPVRIEEGSLLSEILDEPLIQVNSLHHQGVRRLGNGLVPVAYAPDGLIEAFELRNHPFGLAVQWHPEWVLGEHRTPALFEAFVQAAANGEHA